MKNKALYNSSKDLIPLQFGTTLTKFRATSKVDLDYDTYRHTIAKPNIRITCFDKYR